MRNQATWADLARLHNSVCDSKTIANKVIRDGVTPLEGNQLMHALHDLEQARAAVEQCLRHHPKWQSAPHSVKV